MKPAIRPFLREEVDEQTLSSPHKRINYLLPRLYSQNATTSAGFACSSYVSGVMCATFTGDSTVVQQLFKRVAEQLTIVIRRTVSPHWHTGEDTDQMGVHGGRNPA